MEKYPPAHICNAGYDRSSRSDRPLAFVKGNFLYLILLFFIGEGEISRFLGFARGEQAAIHSQPVKNALLHKIFLALAGELPDQVACYHIPQVLILPDSAKILVRLEILQAVEKFLPAGRG